MNAKIDVEVIASKRFKDCGAKTVRLLEEPNNNLHHRRTYQFIGQIGHNRSIVL